MNRPSWWQLWNNVAWEISTRSPDPRRKVGCIIVTSDNTKILSLGFNGDYKGGNNKPASSEPGCSKFIHAEENALLKCDYHYPLKKIMYVTTQPCENCAYRIINSNIHAVIYDENYRNNDGIDLLKKVGMKVFNVHDDADLIKEMYDEFKRSDV